MDGLKNLINHICCLYFRGKMVLSQDMAQFRTSCIVGESIFYRFTIIAKKGESYLGIASITFKLNYLPSSPLPIDHKSHRIHSISSKTHTLHPIHKEKQQQQPIHHDNNFIYLHPQILSLEHENKISVIYENFYNNDGCGVVTFTDVDNLQYLYTQFEPYSANRVFPLFDQPDLKSKMKLKVVCPGDWNVVSNGREGQGREISKEEVLEEYGLKQCEDFLTQFNGYYETQFQETKPLPTYLYAFILGPYFQIDYPSPQNKQLPQMRLFCIQSLAPELKSLAPFIFDITVNSMKFFTEYFGYAFPFEKYDQIFAHEYVWGAMENASCVTFDDGYLYKGGIKALTPGKMFRLAYLIAHELSHHWFGNLVSLKWWDDLWLKESLADFIAHFCLQKINPSLTTLQLPSPMLYFLKRKVWGYNDDQISSTTHPIKSIIPNTSIATAIFDGITYSKGAACIKQLIYIVGEQRFGEGLRRYFEKFAWKSACLEDFIEMLFPKGEKDVHWWGELLEKESVNIISVVKVVKDGKNVDQKGQSLVIKMQCLPSFLKQKHIENQEKYLRPMLIKIALFYLVDEDLKKAKKIQMKVLERVMIHPKPINIVEIGEMEAGIEIQGVLLNYDDQAFVKVKFDENMVEFCIQHLSGVEDEMARGMIWRVCYELVRDAVKPSTFFISLFMQHIRLQMEQSLANLEIQCQHLLSTITQYTPPSSRGSLSLTIITFLTQYLSHQHHLQTILMDKLPSFCKHITSIDNQQLQSHEQHLYLRNLLYELMDGDNLGEEQNWEIVCAIFGLSDSVVSWEQKWRIFEKTKQRFGESDTSRMYGRICQGISISSEEQFFQVYENIFMTDKSSVLQKTAFAKGLTHPSHHNFLKKLKTRLFEDLKKIATDPSCIQLTLELLLPLDGDLPTILTLLSSFSLQLPHDSSYDKLRIKMKKFEDDLRRRIVAEQCFARSQQKQI